jgi:hypothetical protein
VGLYRKREKKKKRNREEGKREEGKSVTPVWTSISRRVSVP